MLGRTDKSSPIPEPPEPSLIEEFNEKRTGGPSKRLGRLRLDLEGPVRSPWNMRAARCFRKNFNKSELYHRWPNDLVEEAFLRHIETIRINYHKQVGRVPASATLERQIQSARRSRMKTVSPVHLHLDSCNLHSSDCTAHSQQTVYLQCCPRCRSVHDLREPVGRRGWHERR